MVYTDNHTDAGQFIIFPSWVKKASKCATHSHRIVITGHKFGARVINTRTLKIDGRTRHSLRQCVSIHTELIR